MRFGAFCYLLIDFNRVQDRSELTLLLWHLGSLVFPIVETRVITGILVDSLSKEIQVQMGLKKESPQRWPLQGRPEEQEWRTGVGETCTAPDGVVAVFWIVSISSTGLSTKFTLTRKPARQPATQQE